MTATAFGPRGDPIAGVWAQREGRAPELRFGLLFFPLPTIDKTGLSPSSSSAKSSSARCAAAQSRDHSSSE